MTTMTTNALPARRRDRTATLGWILSGLFAAFMLGASVMPKVAGLPVAAKTMADLGWTDAPLQLIGGMELAFTLLFLWPRTASLGAVLMMGILGGAMATQIRADAPLFSHVLFSVYLGAAMWGGLWLREPRLRALVPLRRA